MRHIYIRGIIGLIWLIAAIVCGGTGGFPMMGLYITCQNDIKAEEKMEEDTAKRERDKKEREWAGIYAR